MRTGLTVIAHITAKQGHQDEVREALSNWLLKHAKSMVASITICINPRKIPVNL